jgi:2-polyprenyl-6-methoxyphenol hydroxylase-like FAD-dependent oxidoreductase
MTEIERILVVGGGIGGLSTSIALRRAGFAVDVVEKNPKWDVYGVGMIQPANALRVLHEIGLAEQCVAAGHPMYGDKTWLGDGDTFLVGHDWEPLVEGLPPGNGIARPALHRILQDAVLGSGTEVRAGVTLTTLEDDGDQVTVGFTDGDTRAYDLVIGADGLRSQVREMVFGPDVQPNYTGQVCWRYNLPRIEGLDHIWVYIGATGTAGFVPLGPDLMYMLMIEKPPAGESLRLPVEGLAAKMRERLAQFGGPVAEHTHLIVDDAAVVYRPVENVVLPPPWHKGRVVVLGDAAHATSPHCGQGAAQAIEDGVVLTQELQAKATLPEAFDAFMQRRYDRCRFIVEGSEAIGAWEQDHSLPIDPSAKRFEVTMAAMAPL